MHRTKKLADGREVIERQRAHMPHPHPSQGGRLTEFSTVNELLLADGTVVYECDFTSGCTYVNSSARSVLAHQTSHNSAKSAPRYPAETLRLLVRAARVEIRDRGHRGYAERVAALLNARGVRMLNGREWDNDNVSHVFNLYKDRVQVRVPTSEVARTEGRRPRAVEDSKTSRTSASVRRRVTAAYESGATMKSRPARVKQTSRSHLEVADGGSAFDALDRDLGRLITLAEGIRVALRATVRERDESVTKKARLWDEMQRFLGESK